MSTEDMIILLSPTQNCCQSSEQATMKQEANTFNSEQKQDLDRKEKELVLFLYCSWSPPMWKRFVPHRALVFSDVKVTHGRLLYLLAREPEETCSYATFPKPLLLRENVQTLLTHVMQNPGCSNTSFMHRLAWSMPEARTSFPIGSQATGQWRPMGVVPPLPSIRKEQFYFVRRVGKA